MEFTKFKIGFKFRFAREQAQLDLKVSLGQSPCALRKWLMLQPFMSPN